MPRHFSIDNAPLELNRRFLDLLDSLSALSALTEIPAGKLSEEALLHRAVESLMRNQDMERCSVFMLGDDKILRNVAGRDWDDLLRAVDEPAPADARRGREFRLGEGLIGLAAETGELQHCCECARDPRFTAAAPASPAGGGGPVNGSLICIPIIAVEAVVGVLNVFHPDPEFFNHLHERVLLLYGKMLGQLLINNRLLTQMEELVAVRTQRMELALDEARALRTRSEEAARAKGDFLAAMSHEIRTPMNVVIGMSDMLLEMSEDALQRTFITKMQAAGNTLLELIDNILDLSKIDAGQLRLSRDPFLLHQLLWETVDLFAIAAEEKGLDVCLNIADEVPARVLGDSARFRQVVMNLLGNALKFTDKGGISLNVTAAEKSPGVHFEVTDSGIGIGPEHLGVIFDHFTQADGGVTRQYGGSGLGLTISKRLVEAMGGAIRVESEVGIGSTFHLDVPFPEAGMALREAGDGGGKPIEGRDRGALTILLAEDSADNQMLIEAYLAASPHRLVTVMDGQEALDRIQTSADGEAFDLILMDMQMPVMDGYEATRAIREWEWKEGRHPTPIIALTAYALEGDAAKSIEAGCDAHLTKPIKKGRLLEAITRMAGVL